MNQFIALPANRLDVMSQKNGYLAMEVTNGNKVATTKHCATLAELIRYARNYAGMVHPSADVAPALRAAGILCVG